MASQILKYVDFTKTQKSRYRKNGTFFFSNKKKIVSLISKGTLWQKIILSLFDYFFIYIEKNSIFTTEGKLP